MLWFLVLESLCIAALAGGYFAGKKSRIAAAAGIVILTCALVCKAWLHWNPVAEAALFPWRDYVYLQGYWLFLISSGFSGLAASYLRQESGNRKRNALIAFGLFLILFGGYRHSWMAFPQDHGEEAYAAENHHIRQSTVYTCAPCACVSAASYFGVRASEREMAGRCLTSRMGTNIFNVYRGLALTMPEDRFSVRIREVGPDDLCADGVVAVSTWLSRNHAVCTAGKGVSVVVHDPLRDAPSTHDRSFFKGRSGFVAVVIEPIR